MLKTIELMHMFQKRARGTELDGNSHAIFSVRSLLAEQAAHGEIRRDEFAQGLVAAVLRAPNSAVAGWILTELMEEAARWEATMTGRGEIVYSHSKHGATVREKPAIVAAMEHSTAILQEGAQLLSPESSSGEY